ncbi:MAG: hypothetical protein B7Y56_03040 [Gallionellales bacterium 35-53-114]|jgi:SPP1 family predicted phage head-tail adaptor|nr:MAG: hypothetical protein B7Y56_03040 [Gallionellales bacterium 35-53-114]OYZ65083.1 MAG: hypothetical protein B7Y04_00200 [Gallionellales bacterium 24-53-125]OZB07992.1 MAG: hypothetical protein B7X61_10650 [Gallionellales bacterium 39-52-133]HQS59733.1 phage head closure protein [Gallionellaceae bacterium]HQS76487.1 phage head closure protein [Gallionellaceae bacterium]
MAIRAGKLNRRIIIQTVGTTQDAIGEPGGDPTTFATVWASVEDLTGREFIAAGGTQNEAQTKIAIRYLAGVLPAMRVLDGSTAYNIESVLGQDKKSLLLMCKRLA